MSENRVFSNAAIAHELLQQHAHPAGGPDPHHRGPARGQPGRERPPGPAAATQRCQRAGGGGGRSHVRGTHRKWLLGHAGGAPGAGRL
ncbi:hypothetical protein G6F22_021748 [Rhizopus arrhizus]|nr:hypothetical protein G6F22_021748 [Rhizopus arrhizus]